ncbi:MAG: Hpt domain-containing protein [Lachnospiraceae bacterium]|nr:Hpt domain-containing protein [Lachnospiraceae bacterium]
MNRYKLTKAGIDVNEGIRRFNNNKEMYEKFLMTFPQDPLYARLDKAIKDQDVKEAFQAAHALKGVSGNLSLIELHQQLIPLVEELRNDSLEKAPELFVSVSESYTKVIAELNEASKEE